MASELPRAVRTGQGNQRLIWALLAVIVALAVLVVTLMSGLFTDEVTSDRERDYRLLLEGLESNPENPAVLMTLAEVEYELGKTEEAFEHAEKAVEHAEGQATFFLRYAQLLIREDRIDEAKENLITANQLAQEGFIEPKFLLAQVYANEGDTAQALQLIEEVLVVNPVAADIRVYYARVLEQDGQTDRAVEEYKNVLRFLPDNEEAIQALARLGVEWEPTDTTSPHGGDVPTETAE